MQIRHPGKLGLCLPVLVVAFLTIASTLSAAVPLPVRVLVWDEQQPEQKRAYGDKFLGETIAAHLAAQPGFTVKNASLTSPSQGLDEAALIDTDVLIWWSHVKNPFVTDDNVERIVTRVAGVGPLKGEGGKGGNAATVLRNPEFTYAIALRLMRE